MAFLLRFHTVSLPKIDAGTELQGQMFFANDAYAVYSGASDAEKEAAAAWLDYSFNFDGCKANCRFRYVHSK